MIAAFLASVVVLTTISTVGAYHQLIPPGGWNAIGDCEDTDESPCIRWRKSGGSIVIKMFLDSSLDLGYIDLATDVESSVTAYNAIPAYNPLIQYTTNDGNDHLKAKVIDFNDYQVFGSAVLQPQPFTAENNRINHATIRFNTEIVWTRQTGGWCGDYGAHLCYADARKVANHEMGHAQGLAHEASPTQAVMRQGFVSWFAVQDDDEDGIIHMYGAIP